MTLLSPLALWGLLALAVPLLLHLRRRRVGRTIQVGSLKHLETLPTAERRGLRVRDAGRLLLRLAILTLLVLLLARPVLEAERGAERTAFLVDRSAPSSLRDSLARAGDLIVADLASPWVAVAHVDDSLPPGIPLTVAATTASDRFNGPRPLVRREVRWIDAGAPPAPSHRATEVDAPSAAERRALAAAVAATAEVLGALHDTVGWEGRLPRWWRDSLGVAAFPAAVAQALLPERALPAPTRLGAAQLAPREIPADADSARSTELHWWVWGLVVLLFLAERLWARKLERTA